MHASLRRWSVTATLALLLAAVLARPAHADLIDHVTTGNHVVFADGPGTTGGGEFTITVLETLDTFVTFCLQKTRFLNFSDTFSVTGVNPYAMTETMATGGDGSGRDGLSNQTAYLYWQFRRGMLPGYVPGSAASANDLQLAFWWFEEEGPNPGNAFVTLANDAVASGWANEGRVGVLNLAFPNGDDAQDQLVLVPEPASITLLGVGLGLAYLRLRRKPRTGNFIEG